MSKENQISLFSELARKLVHLSSLYIPFLYWFTNQKTTLMVVIPITALVIGSELLRFKLKGFNRLFTKLFSFMLREGELESKSGQPHFTGASHFMLAALMTVAFFAKEIAVPALMILIISDTIAALVGRQYGKRIIIGHKTVRGFMAFIISAMAVVMFTNCIFCFDWFIRPAQMFALLIAASFELFEKQVGVDDNFSIPLGYALIAYLVV